MAKLNWGQVIANLAQTQTGMLTGQAMADEKLRQQKLEQQQREMEHDRLILSILPQLSRESQAPVLGNIVGRSAARAGIEDPYQAPQALTPWARAQMERNAATTPGASSPLPPPLLNVQHEPPGSVLPVVTGAPTAAPAPGGRQRAGAAMAAAASARGAGVAQADLAGQIAALPFSGAPPVPYQAPQFPAPPVESGRGFVIPGHGRVELRGVDPKEAQRVLDDIRRSRERVSSQGFVKDATTQANLAGILRRVPTKPVQDWTDEDFAQAKQAQADYDSAAAYLGKQYPEIQTRMDREEVAQFEKDLKNLSGYRADNLQQELIRLRNRARGIQERGYAQVPSLLMAQLDDIDLMEQALQSGTPEGKRQAGLILGLVREELAPEGKEKDPLKAFDALLGQMSRWATVSPEAQAPFVRRLKQAAADAGIDPNSIPNSFDRQMSEEARLRLQQAKTNAENTERHRAWQRRHGDAQEARLKRQSERDDRLREAKLTPQQREQVATKKAKRDNLYQRRNQILQLAPTDLAEPGAENAASRQIKTIDEQIDVLNREIEGIAARARAPERGGATGKGGGKPVTGGLMGELSDPNRPENRAQGKAGAGGQKSYTAQQLRGMSQGQRQEILKRMPVSERLKMLGEIAGAR